MSWRIRTTIAIFALVIFFLGAQPMLRRAISNTIARHASGRVHVDGWTTWSAAQNTVTVSQLRIQNAQGGTIRIESLSAKVNPRELLRRNLVLDTATLDGVVIQPTFDNVPSMDDALIGENLRIPTFQDSVWASAIRRRCQERMQNVTDERAGVRAALESQCERLQRRAESLSKLEQNPLRNREDLEEARREWVVLRQAVAEERVRLREVDKELQRDTVQIHEAWPEQLTDAIQSTLPNRQQAIQQAVSQRVANYLDEYRAVLDVALASVAPVPQRKTASHGVDVLLPGIAENYTWIRSASIFGRIECPDRLPVLFKCKLDNWCPTNAWNKPRPRMEWRFQLPYAGGSRAIEAEVERISQDQNGTTKISLAMHEEVGQSEPDSSRVLWQCSSLGNVLELNLPFCSSVDGESTRSGHTSWNANPVWIDCWDDTMKQNGRLQMQVTVSTAGAIDCSVHPNSQSQLQRLWDSTRTRYVDRTREEAFPRVKRVLDEATRARQQAWIQVSSEQNELLARIEDEASRIKLTLDASDTIPERFARKP